MATRPDSRDVARPVSTNSVGVTSVSQSMRSEDVAEELTSNLVHNVFEAAPRLAFLEEELKGVQDKLKEAQSREGDLQQKLAQQEEEQTSLKQALSERDAALSERDAELTALRDAEPSGGGDDAVLELEIGQLRARVSELEGDLAAQGKETYSTQPTMELPNEGSEEQTLLAAAYQQIALLNTQLAHLYTELTMARTEVQHLRGTRELGPGGGQEEQQQNGEGENQKQSQQIADLVGDIRHLQLDLEYHQQKLDQMIEEKQTMMKDLKQCRSDYASAKQLAEEREQMLRHRDVDIQHLRQELKSPQVVAGDDSMLHALRTEAAAKDSALIVSHYELHKEKLMRDRLEQKNAKLMERMQKLMMVVETMRRENLSLEKLVAAKDKAHDEKDVQLRLAMQKARQLQKVTGKDKGKNVQLQLGPPQHSLPPVNL
mmetsp:Transcript_173253/g.555706  ORF Transcript_173253/g.555706 Transcript_173253/m.555706 type:complete len:430 (-) Transcript_173253:157-1446(-)